MNKIMVVLSLGSLVGGLMAEDSLKVCFFDPDKVMTRSSEWSDMLAKVDNKFKTEFDSLKKEEELLKSSALAYKNKQSALSDDARKREEESLMRKQRDLEGKARYTMDDYNNERREVAMKFQKKLEDSLARFATTEGFDVVMPKGPVVYASAKADKTEALIAHLNGSYKKVTTSTAIVKKAS